MLDKASDVEIRLAWENIGSGEVHVRYDPAGGGGGSVFVKHLETTERIRIFLPESKIVFKINDLTPLSLLWDGFGGSGQFNIIDRESPEWLQVGDVFTLRENTVIFNYSEGGIVIQGVLNLADSGR
jgi:hypothetical protein